MINLNLEQFMKMREDIRKDILQELMDNKADCAYIEGYNTGAKENYILGQAAAYADMRITISRKVHKL